MTQWLLAVIAAPVVISLLVLCVREPMRVALPVFAALVPYGGGLVVGPTRFGSLSSLMGIVLAVGLVLQLVNGHRFAPRLYPTLALWLLLLGWAGATVAWTIAPVRTINGFIVLSSLVLVYVLISVSKVDRTALRNTEFGLLFGGVSVTCYGLFQLLVLGGFPSDDPGSIGPDEDGRFGNDLLGPNNEAVALLLPLLIALTRGVTHAERSRRFGYLTISALMFLGILMTGSRGGLLASFVAVIVLTMAVSHGRGRLLAICVVGIVLGTFVFLTTPGGLAARNVETTATSGRTSIWQVGLAACPQYCWAGSGWGTFPEVYAETQATVPGAKVLVGRGGTYEPHNLWVLAVVELGLPGLVMLAAALVLTMLEGVRLPARLRGPPLGALLGMIFAASFLSNLEFKFFWMVLIMVALSRNLNDAQARPAVRTDETTTVADPRWRRVSVE